ncbi:hypothetical protein HJC23_011324 [Cyclotella cryptica]|uniref:Uncharacterized protein n=1 Tax=Cyclotella cryptica TaxID=29204 RepID=A0ABD3QXV7_9STRA
MVSAVAVAVETPATHYDHPISPDEIVYTSLIQTYLNLLCYDNATFLAERLAASYPHSENAIYLLAYCHYRRGSAKSARSILLERWMATNAAGNEGSAVDAELERVRNSARYLLAKCCFDLGLYGEAEEALLRHCREVFGKSVSGGALGGVKIRGNVNEVMDAWIVQTSPCPIPNGPAGLHLLGNICRKSNRRQRAIEYYRLSLKLDPLMWTSYEAICELGGPVGSADEADDPKSVFGVSAPTLSHGNLEAIARDLHHSIPIRIGDKSNNIEVDKVSPSQEPYDSFKLNRCPTPSTPYSGFDRMKIDGNSTSASSQIFTSAKHGRASDIHNHVNRPGTASTIAPRSRARGDSLPQTNLFNVTPALAPQQSFRSPILETPGAAATPHTQVEPPSAIGYANKVLDQARRVAAGLYYEPSPEAINPRTRSPPRGHPTRRRILLDSHSNPDKAPIPDSAMGVNLSFSTNIPLTPHDASSPFHAGLSSVKGEKRALSPMELASRKKHGQEKTEMDNPDQVEMATGHAGGYFELDPATEAHFVGKALQLLCTFGAAYKYLCQYRSHDTLEILREVPHAQINSGWVQHQIGRAYFEMSDYQNAERALVKMQQLEPHRMKGLDVLSTALWHLKKEVELSDLAQKAVDFDRMAPEAWFVVGNCFSFQKEHDTAITFFHRSIQLDPTYTYAHTLCGHEYMSNEDFDKAISCYRDAIRVDSRHYNAWYGLGAIYFRQEKFDLAEYHFQRALEINQQSSVLHCHLGMAQHHNGKTFDALETLAGAFLLDPRNPQAHYQRATIFMSLDRPQEALLELEKVRSAAPREASVHFNMGKVLKRLGQPEKAMRCFLTALDLDPKDNNLVKARFTARQGQSLT